MGDVVIVSANGALVEESQSRARQLELFAPEEIARPDYNIGIHATTLFASPYRKDLGETRRYDWITNRPDGKDGQAQASIVITPLKDHIVPTTTTFKVFMALVQLWRMQGSDPSGTIYFSARQLAEVAGWPYSSAIAKRVKEHLAILKGTNIDWMLAYSKRTEADGVVTERQVNSMNLVDEVTYFERSVAFDQEKFARNHVVRLNPRIIANMIAGHVRPMNHEALRQISSDASTRLYVLLDLYLANKRKWERRAQGLIMDDLDYKGARYEQRKHRRALLEKLIADLNGKELTNGKLRLELRQTKDGKDWKLTAFKDQRRRANRRPMTALLPKADASFLAEELLHLFADHKGKPPKHGYLTFLCTYYPQHIIRDAISRAKADYLGNVRKSLGAVFVYELEQLIKARQDLTWYKDNVAREET